MKARTNKTRWLLIGLLFGFLAVAGLTLVHQHGRLTVAKASPAAAPTHALQQLHTTVLAAAGAKQAVQVPVAVGADEEPVDTDSNSEQPPATAHSTAIAQTSNGKPAVYGAASDVTPQQGSRPATTIDTRQSQGLANSYAYNGYAPIGCELPAGCGNGTVVSVIRQSSGTSGGVSGASLAHNSTPIDDSTPPTNNDTPPPGNNDQGTPGQSQTVTSAPELDPATLAGAITLLLGALAVVASRRVRATR